MSEPMTDARIAEIRHAHDTYQHEFYETRWALTDELLAEVERLRAEVAAMRPIVAAVAAGPTDSETGDCVFCGAAVNDDHDERCLVVTAQSLAYLAETEHP